MSAPLINAQAWPAGLHGTGSFRTRLTLAARVGVCKL
jgi:hypothetical protein